ncbi:MAG: O-antigen ligase family protein [Candidatus Omnitrophica bacterium]|nr:O-antigen ligase family protein [Candidatus Omnitrophota bacterium]
MKTLLCLIFFVPLVFSHSTTEIYGLVKIVLFELGVILLAWRWLMRLPKITISRLGWAAIVYFLACALSLITSFNKYESIGSLLLWAAGIGLYFYLTNTVRTPEETQKICLAVICAAVCACLYSIYEVRGIKFEVLRLAYTSTFGNPIFFSQFLSIALPLGIASSITYFSQRRIYPALLYGASSILVFVFLVLTRSRGAYIGIGAAVLYCLALVWVRGEQKTRRVLKVIAVSSIILIAGLFFLLSKKGALGENINIRNLTRVYLWRSAPQILGDHPVLGVGIGNFKVLYPRYRSQEEREVTPKGIKYTHMHNDYLEILVETGVVGGLCFLGFLGMVFSLFARPFRRKYTLSFLAVGLFCSIISLLIQALFNPVLYIPASVMGFWLLLGSAEVLAKIEV